MNQLRNKLNTVVHGRVKVVTSRFRSNDLFTIPKSMKKS